MTGTNQSDLQKKRKKVLSKEVKTAGQPSQIRLTADRSGISADGQDLSFITVEVLDEEGTSCPNAENMVRFNVSGNGSIVGVDNDSPISMERFKATDRRRLSQNKFLCI